MEYQIINKLINIAECLGVKINIEKINNLAMKDNFFVGSLMDPSVEFSLDRPPIELEISISVISSNCEDIIELFYRNKDEEFSESRKIIIGKADGSIHTISLSYEYINYLRFDFINNNSLFKINKFLISVKKQESKKLKIFNKYIKYVTKYGFSHYNSVSKNYKILSEVDPLNNINCILKNNWKSSPKFQKYQVDILIPIYNGFEFLHPLFKSIEKNSNLNYRLLICNDNSPDERIKVFLNELSTNYPNLVNVMILENEINLGFLKTINRLSKYVKNHFILLNTDVEVPSNWIEKLMQPIFKNKNIATTTPFTNSGTICSFPNYLMDNSIFLNLDVELINKYFSLVNPKICNISVPTGVGFCMGMNKNVFNRIGMFDEIFGQGYGEENDWCMRASTLGYKNLIVSNLFVYHKHGGSFQSEQKLALLKRNEQILLGKHPNYNKLVQQTIRENKHEFLRILMQILIICEETKEIPILLIDHALGGGANLYTVEYLSNYPFNKPKLILRFDKHSNSYLLSCDFENTQLKLKIDTLESFIYLFEFIKIEKIYVNNLVSYPDVYSIIDAINIIKSKTNCKLIYKLHDFFAICQSYTLLDYLGNYCEIPDDLDKCKKCLLSHKGDFTNFVHKADINIWRKYHNKLLLNSDEILVFSNSSKKLLEKVYSDISDKIEVRPHSMPVYMKSIYVPEYKEKVIIGFLGAMGFQKGSAIIESLIEYASKENLLFEFVLIGEIDREINNNIFTVTGKYNREELPKIIKNYKIDIFMIPSIWPETFSYTTSEVILLGYPLAVFDYGAQAEKAREYDKGLVIDSSEPLIILNNIKTFLNTIKEIS